ncbi:BrnA antitoxin family protein [Rhodopila sp.]|uniref:BrnA antitoxin family protein n=1 Tax=Rhodopila sp. TaxID=2480087 RepID=UPI003D12FD9F
MAKKDDTKRYTAEELAALCRNGQSLSDLARVVATTEEELEASIAADPDDAHEADWTQIVVGIPARKQDIHIRLDADVLSWFKGTGRGYQTRINNVLRAFVQSRRV